jgi:hypothetical protein
MHSTQAIRWRPRLATILEDHDLQIIQSHVWDRTLSRLYFQACTNWGVSTYSECIRMCRNLLACHGLQKVHRRGCLAMLRNAPSQYREEDYNSGISSSHIEYVNDDNADEDGLAACRVLFISRYGREPNQRKLFVSQQLGVAQRQLDYIRQSQSHHMYGQAGSNTNDTNDENNNINTTNNNDQVFNNTHNTNNNPSSTTPLRLSPLSPAFNPSASYTLSASHPEASNGFALSTPRPSGTSSLSALAPLFFPAAVSSLQFTRLYTSQHYAMQQQQQQQQQQYQYQYTSQQQQQYQYNQHHQQQQHQQATD